MQKKTVKWWLVRFFPPILCVSRRCKKTPTFFSDVSKPFLRTRQTNKTKQNRYETRKIAIIYVVSLFQTVALEGGAEREHMRYTQTYIPRTFLWNEPLFNIFFLLFSATMSAICKTARLTPRLLKVTPATAGAASGQKRNLNLLEYQAKGLLQVQIVSFTNNVINWSSHIFILRFFDNWLI